MGGRGSSTLSERVSDRGLRQRAEGIHKILAESGMPAKESIDATIERLRQLDSDNGNARLSVKEQVYPTRVKNMSIGFNKYANKDEKAGLKEGTQEIYNQIVRNPKSFDKITNSAERKYQASIDSLNKQLITAKSSAEIDKIAKERDRQFGKLNAVKFIKIAKK